MNVPLHLEHKPIIVIKDYETIDGMYAPPYPSDAKFLSIGHASYTKDSTKDEKHMSAKVLRHNGRWSRQSEELPIHRVLDLANFIVSTMLIEKKGVPTGSMLDANTVPVSKAGFEELLTYYKKHEEILLPRLKDLKTQLNKLI